MSRITLICKQGKTLRVGSLHWRELDEHLMERLKKMRSTRFCLDEGYLLLDFDTLTILDCQGGSCVRLPGWTYLRA